VVRGEASFLFFISFFWWGGGQPAPSPSKWGVFKPHPTFNHPVKLKGGVSPAWGGLRGKVSLLVFFFTSQKLHVVGEITKSDLSDHYILWGA